MSAIWIAADSSGSVGNSNAYFQELERVLNETPTATAYYMWDSTVNKTTEAAFRTWVKHKTGYGGTEPSNLAVHIVKESFHGTLRFFTDGQVTEKDVEECDRTLHGEAIALGLCGHVFEKVEAYIVETGSEVNLSVLMPFTRFSPFEVKRIPRNKAFTLDVVSQADLDLFEAFLLQQKDLDFEEKAERLKEVARARFMGTTGSARVRDAAIQTKNRLTQEMSLRLGSDVGQQLLNLLEAPEDSSGEALAVAKIMVSNFIALKGDSPAIKTLDAIIGLCDGVAKKCFSKADAEKALSTPAQRAQSLQEPAETLPLAQEEESQEEPWFQCPVTLEESTSNVVLMLASFDGESFLDGLEEDFKKLLATNPLWLWLRPDHVERFASMLDDLLTCQALREAQDVGAPIVISPTTRKPLVSAFPLSTSSEDHFRARRWALSKAIAGGKRWGNPDLWFVNLALVVQRQKVSERLQQALPLILACLRSHLATAKTYASLSGLPELPMTSVPVSVACWLVASGPTYDYPKMSLQLLPLREEIRWVAEDLMGYRLPKGASVALDRLQIVQSMRDWKMGKTPRGLNQKFEATCRLDNLLVALVQKCMRLSSEDTDLLKNRLPHLQIVEFVELDGEASEEQRSVVMELLPEIYRKHANSCGWHDLLELARFADASKKPSECVPSLEVRNVELSASVEWGYGLKHYDRCIVPICVDTARPFSCVVRTESEASTWQQEVEAFYGFPANIKLMISAHECYGNFVVDREFYPSEAEFALYLRQKWIVSRKKTTLPHLLPQFLSEILESVAPVICNIDAKEFAARFEASRPCSVRKLLEEAYFKNAADVLGHVLEFGTVTIEHNTTNASSDAGFAGCFSKM
jgi:hypothetical protein